MIKVFPDIKFSAKCPHDGSDLEIVGITIPGMRCLADTVCKTCGNKYYADLPVGHAIWSPLILDQQTGKITSQKEITWFGKVFEESFVNVIDTEIIPIVHKFFHSERIIILNCIDFLYGHSLLKLLNAQRYIDNYPELGCCVIVPTQLVHLVPEGVAEIWEVPISIKESWKWYPSLQTWINNQINQRKECFLSRAYSHPSNKVYDLQLFVRNLPDISNDIENCVPIILFSYREDRLWGRTLAHQERNLQKLYERLSNIFPNMAFVLVGFGKQNQIKATKAKFVDLRIDKFDVELDRLWMAYMDKADCAIGIHGSNMLLPSGLAKSTVELLPRSRLGNFFQDILCPHDLTDIRDAFLRYRFIYGKDNLSDIQTFTVTQAISSIIAYSERHASWFKLGETKANSLAFSKPPSECLVSQAAFQYFANSSLPHNFLIKIKRKIQALFYEGLHRLDTLH